MMNETPDFSRLFAALERSAFRRRFRLKGRDLALLRERGMAVVLGHARDFVAQRLAPADPADDGRQTPMRGHPVFVAQHATATCCRGCLAKWHRIPRGRPLASGEQDHIVSVIRHWLERQAQAAAEVDAIAPAVTACEPARRPARPRSRRSARGDGQLMLDLA